MSQKSNQKSLTEKNGLRTHPSHQSYSGNTDDSSKIKETGNIILNFIKKQLMVVLIITGAFFGFIIGYGINGPVQDLNVEAKYNVIILIGFPGELLIRMLKMLILPLITCSLIVGLANLDSKVSGKVGGRAVVYYLSTTLIAAILGIILVSAIQPGDHMSRANEKQKDDIVRPLDSFMDIIRNMFPSNIVGSCVSQDKTKIEEIISKTEYTMQKYNTTGKTKAELNTLVKNKVITMEMSGNEEKYYEKKYKVYKVGKGVISVGKANYLGIIVFAIAVGIVAGRMKEESLAFVQFLSALNEIIAKLIIVVMWYSPIGICSLIMAKFANMDDIDKTFESLAYFIVTVITAIAIHGFIILPSIFFLLTRTNPYRYLKGMVTAMTTAFGTSSSAATLPVTFRCLEEKLNVDKRITRFILPIGTTINMDGTALYEAVSAIFIAQTIGRTLSVGDYFIISFTSILASMGAAAIPSAGLVTMLIVLDTVGLPNDMIAVIFSVDWFLDRFRTMINVLGDAYGAGIVQHLSKADLEADDVFNATDFNSGPTNNAFENNRFSTNFDAEKQEDEDETVEMRERKLTYC